MIYKKDIYVVKEHDAEGSVNSVKNGGFIATDTYSVYPNGFFRCSNDGRYTKHIYIGAERIASQVGGKPYPSPNTESVSVAGRSNGIDIRVDYSGKLDQHLAQIDSVYDAFDLPYNGTNHDSYYNNYFFDRPGYWDNTVGLTLNGGKPETPRGILDRDLLYYYHRDHLGSSTAVSNDDGKLSQQIEYLPYGEVFLEKQMASSDYHSPYKFNGKELDEETGLYYYGARYMNPRLSIWYATDPVEEKYPNISSYAFCKGNPISYIDLNGKETYVIIETKGTGHTLIVVNDKQGMTTYTYGRYAGGDWYTVGSTGQGVLIRYNGDLSKKYISSELFHMNAKAYKIKDANDSKVREFFDQSYNASTKHPNTQKSDINTYGRVIDKYVLFGNNCTTKSCDALKYGSSNIFTFNGNLYDYDEDFTIPSSLLKFLRKMAAENSNVIDVTDILRNQLSEYNQESLKSVGSSGSSSGSSGNSSGSSANSSSSRAMSSGNGSGSFGSGSNSSSSQDYD